ncbi:hypothetical protein [Aurantiacibacter marinus]|uniref:DUF306 domain-containing protein n=1 Tax=Aurantiacibacter marinus TaxID=874156 RepID=A0A0H0XXI0_9SPHN|nr:hypothetical protein [Aurantiacibacter marinus]KLI65005.1 hypothetical protein AAV99_05890 [Aurantiacibacter marinus]
MMKHLLSFFAALIVFTQPAAAQDLEGTWAMQIDEAAIFVFSLEQDEDGSWRGSWLRPGRFQGNGVVFSQFRGSERVVTTDGEMDGDVLVMRFAPTRAEGSTDVLHFRSTGEYQAEMTYTGTDLDPYPLVRVAAGTALGPFSDDRIYDRDNAATQADYDPADELAASLSGSDPAEAEPDVSEATDAAAEEPVAEEREGISDDFLDGLEDGALATTGLEVAKLETAPRLARACADIDRTNLPAPEDLGQLWGDEFESIGSGLEIREYQMDNGDIARVTLLGDSIYLNSCGPAS